MLLVYVYVICWMIGCLVLITMLACYFEIHYKSELRRIEKDKIELTYVEYV